VFDHVGIVVANLDVARAFYTACLAPLQYRLLQDLAQTPTEGRLVYGRGGRADPFFVVAAGRPSFWTAANAAARAPDHLAFVAPDRGAVDAFHAAGLRCGGRDNGAPGARRSSTDYYAAFLIDPDGNNVEAGVRS
jgi:catechol 2,3-dioxygenase-like lactoylglutathione lyase family enzyme